MGYAKTDTTARAARLVCGAAGTAVAATWAALTNTGKFTVTIDGTKYSNVTPDFTGATTMALVATAVQTALAASLTGTLCTWNSDHFEIVSPSVGPASAVSVLAAPGAGVDLAAAAYMNGKTGYANHTDQMRDVAGLVGPMRAHSLADLTAKFGNDASTVKDRFDSIDGNIADLMDDVGDGSAATLGDIYGILGNPAAQSLNVQLGYGAAGSVAADLAAILAGLGIAGTISGTADNGTTATLVDNALTQVDDYFNGQILVMTSGANVGLSRVVSDFDAASDTVTVENPFPLPIVASATYTILPRDAWMSVLLGANNNNNVADTSLVVANADGSVVERQEYVQAAVDAIQTDLGNPSARTNLQTIVALLGNPDAANKSLYGNIGDFVAQTNLQSLLAALGIPDTAGKPLYTCLVTDRLDSGTFGLSASRTALETASLGIGAGSAAANQREGLILRWIADNLPGGATEVETTSLDAADGSIADNVRAGLLIRWLADAVNALVVPDVAGTAAGLIGALVVPDAAGVLATAIAVPGADSAANTNMRDVVGNKTDTVAGGSLMGYAKNLLLGVTTVNNGVTGAVAAVNRLTGKTQVLNVPIAIAANAAATVIATATTKPVLIKSFTLYAVAAQTADLTNIVAQGAGAGTVVTFVDAVAGLRANLDAAGKQVSWASNGGRVYLPAGGTIQVDPTGGGATALNLIASIEYIAAEDGGYLA